MLEILPKCTTYDNEVKQARKLIQLKYVFLILPSIIIIAIGAVLAYILRQPYLLILSAIGILYLIIISAIMTKRFDRLTKEISKKFLDYYKPNQSAVLISLMDDNKGFTPKVSAGNPLMCWMEQEQLNFISSKICLVQNLKLMKCSAADFDKLINSDFGKLQVSLGDIDHYREATLVCKYGSDICRLKFADEKAFEKFIPTKEYYYASHKKEWQ